ncbi:uncharacterized protein LOC127750889 isoform X2 [Frankliniella occidentalis]|uniref:Uncharacterized protein LOC127750889 isoform X2 n=1 Tax=Frankliniella occidentalis TaxID=133901 RepID=A0A9C6X5I9_FRAOC|nr:uncharacterized protein LOC127750889 isoform X2 [Frankliniella occidentalis]
MRRLSVYGCSDRTSNACESANATFASECGTKKPSVYTFLYAIKELEDSYWNDCQDLENGHTCSRGQELSVMANDEVIKNLSIDLAHGQISVERFLAKTSRRIQGVYEMVLNLKMDPYQSMYPFMGMGMGMRVGIGTGTGMPPPPSSMEMMPDMMQWFGMGMPNQTPTMISNANAFHPGMDVPAANSKPTASSKPAALGRAPSADSVSTESTTISATDSKPKPKQNQSKKRKQMTISSDDDDSSQPGQKKGGDDSDVQLTEKEEEEEEEDAVAAKSGFQSFMAKLKAKQTPKHDSDDEDGQGSSGDEDKPKGKRLVGRPKGAQNRGPKRAELLEMYEQKCAENKDLKEKLKASQSENKMLKMELKKIKQNKDDETVIISSDSELEMEELSVVHLRSRPSEPKLPMSFEWNGKVKPNKPHCAEKTIPIDQDTLNRIKVEGERKHVTDLNWREEISQR